MKKKKKHGEKITNIKKIDQNDHNAILVQVGQDWWVFEGPPF